VVVLAEGRLVGQGCAEAHPAEVMDLTFATQALAVERLATAADPLPPGVHPVPAAVEERVARRKLATLGVRCDHLTPPRRAICAAGASAPDTLAGRGGGRQTA
jgi:adenosylhomocysteinase